MGEDQDEGVSSRAIILRRSVRGMNFWARAAAGRTASGLGCCLFCGACTALTAPRRGGAVSAHLYPVTPAPVVGRWWDSSDVSCWSADSCGDPRDELPSGLFFCVHLPAVGEVWEALAAERQLATAPLDRYPVVLPELSSVGPFPLGALGFL